MPRDYSETAGIACYYNYDNYYYCFLSRDDDGHEIVSVISSVNKDVKNSENKAVDCKGKSLYLKAQVRERELQFYYSVDGEVYLPVGDVLDMRNLSDERIDWNGFTGAMVGVTCQDLCGIGCHAEFDWLDYEEKL
jgi:xylan 1,4-beta-xylosidase